jgi:peptide/nickel transport system substrate-binding protein
VRRRECQSLFTGLLRSGWLAAVLCLTAAAPACRGIPPAPAESTTLRIGFGLPRGRSDANGLMNVANQLAQETLITIAEDGRPQPALADRWAVSDDGLTWTVHIREGVSFHNGEPLTSDILAEAMTTLLPDRMGVAFRDVVSIRAGDGNTVQVVLTRPSNLFVESLDFLLYTPQRGGTGAYRKEGDLELRANDHYWDRRPAIDHIVFRSYDSTRAAWADMLRNDLDMLFAVGGDAADSFAGAHQVRLFEFERRYAYEIRLNVQRPGLGDPEIRRRLNAAIDRPTLIAEGLGGHGRPEESPLWPKHWALPSPLPTVRYDPVPLGRPLHLTLLFPDDSLERLALAVQRQLSVIGVTLTPERVSLDEWNRRVAAGDFDAVLSDAQRGPSIQRSVRFWYTGNPLNYGRFSSRAVDAAIDAIRDSRDDAGYRRGVAALGRAIVDDPPAIYLAWAQSLRAVSTRFEPPADPTRDVMFSIPQWRLAPVRPTLTH